MDPRIVARARQRWRAMLFLSAATTTGAVFLALWAAVVTASAAGADAITLFIVVSAALVVLTVVLTIVLGISWWVLKRRDALGPSLLWGADRATRRRVATGLRRQHRLTGVDHELALNEAGRTTRFGLLLPTVLFVNVGVQAGWLATGWDNAGDNPLLFGTRLVAIAFFSWGGCQALVAFRRARGYLARFADAPPEPTTLLATGRTPDAG